MENGVCFSSPESAGLRVLRAARLAFIYSIESTANGVVERQRRQQRSEEHRPLAILDVSELDFTFSQAAVQSTVELGLHGESQCHMTFVPLTDAAAQAALNPLASFVRQAVEVPGKALRDPFELVPLRYFDVGAYTAYLDLTTALPTSSATSTPHTRRNDSVSGISARAALALRGGLRRPHDPAAPLARALGTMRKGAAMLVTFMPTPDSRAAVYKELQRQHHPRAEVEMETRAVDAAKMVIAEAISRTGRWSSITDEVLPSVDCPQGSALSLTVVME